MRELERVIMLRVVDEYWMDHIDAMTELRQGIGLRGYPPSDPLGARAGAVRRRGNYRGTRMR